MRALVLSAGRGTRLRPRTDRLPKCLLTVRGDERVLEVQLRTLAACGIDEAAVLVGFGAAEVESCVARCAPAGLRVETVFDPFYAVSDNLATCWLAREHMQDELLILNGDTLFEPAVLRRLLRAPDAALTLAVDRKDAYDDDDMKVSLASDGRLVGVDKGLDPRIVDAESIGMMRFDRGGARRFRRIVEAAMRREDAMERWYLSAVNEMAQETAVQTVSVTGLWWGELDCEEDLAALRAHLDDGAKPEARVDRALSSPRR